MPDIGKTLKDEIARIAKRESNKLLAGQSKTVRALKQSVAVLKQQLAQMEKARQSAVDLPLSVQADSDAVVSENTQGKWFTARGVIAIRKRLGLSQMQFGKLLGVSQKCVSHWEVKKGKLNLRAKTLAGLLKAREMGRREAQAGLEAEGAPKKSKTAATKK